MNCLVDWRGGREAEGVGLENRYAGNGIEGSNPSLSANLVNLFCNFLGVVFLKLFRHHNNLGQFKSP